MMILFCADPLRPRQVDADFAAERDAAIEAGLQVALLDDEALRAQDIERALRQVPEGAGALCVYRGWMMPPARYALFHDALEARGWRPLTTPDAYRTAHWLPEAYPYMAHATAETRWIACASDALPWAQLDEALDSFGAGALIIKDYVKSQKHAWDEACYIPDASARDHARRVIERFVALQGELEGGLVMRAYVPLRATGVCPRSGLIWREEHRAFVLEGQVLLSAPHWGAGATQEVEAPPVAAMIDALRDLPARFFTMDIARAEDGAWIIVELGDGQVAGLPPGVDAGVLYEALARFAQASAG